MSAVLTIAMSKGYLMKEAIRIFNKLGIEFEDDLNESRKLFTMDTSGRFKLLQVRPWDVPEYVAGGAADIGVVGRDVLAEKQSPVLSLLDLKFGQCRLVLAGPKHVAKKALRHDMVVGTKFPHLTQQHFNKLGLKVKLVKLYGSIELAPLTGLSDIICDLTATGTTLKENGLEVMESVLSSTAYLVANPISYRVHYDVVKDIVDRMSVELS